MYLMCVVKIMMIWNEMRTQMFIVKGIWLCFTLETLITLWKNCVDDRLIKCDIRCTLKYIKMEIILRGWK
jgi:hypothetical protein